MSKKYNVVLMLTGVLLAGCATGKPIDSVDDVLDDGKRSAVLITHDLQVYVTNKDSSVESTNLTFRCPQGKGILKVTCFDVRLPYLGTKQIDGYGLHAFELSGAIAVKMKYDNYLLRSVLHSVVIERVPETSCYYNKRTRRDTCRTRINDVSRSYKAGFPTPIAISVEPGAGCYLGHLSMTMVDNEIREFELDTQTPLDADQLTNMATEVADALLKVVDRPC